MFDRKQEQNQVGDIVTQAIGKGTQDDKEFTLALWCAGSSRPACYTSHSVSKEKKLPQP